MTLLAKIEERLLGTEVHPPPVGLAAGLPAGVRLRAGRLVPAIGGLLARMGAPAAAVTLGRTIVVHPRVRLTKRLLAHELEHVRQWEADALFPLRYTLETLRVGYRNNRYEQAARAAEASLDGSA